MKTIRLEEAKKKYIKNIEKRMSTIVAAQDQALCTRNMRNVFVEKIFQSICRVCGVFDEPVAHIVLKGSKLVQKEYN